MSLPILGRSALGRRRRPSRLGFEDLEGRLVMASPVMAPLPAIASVQAAAVPVQQVALTSNVSIDVDNVVRNTQTGAIIYRGTASSTTLDPATSVPFTAVITPPRNPRGVPTLTMIIPQTSRTVQGLGVSTDGATLTLTPRQGAAGSTLIAGLRAAISQGTTVPLDQASATLESILGSPQVSTGVDRGLRTARSVLRSFSVETATSPATLVLDVNPVNVNVAGLSLRLNNGQNRQIRLNLSGTSTGGFLGNYLVGIVGEGQRRLVQSRLQTSFALLLSQI